MPLTGRGAGTSIAGNALSTGLVLDTSRYLNKVLSVDPGSRTAVVEPGAVLDAITKAAAPHGLRFGPDPSTHSRCTIGGAIGNNACGSRALRYGRTADNVVSLDVLAGSGLRFTAVRYGKDGPDAAAPEAGLLAGLRGLADGDLAVIRTEFGRFTRQVSGYSLEHLLPERGADLAKALVGTEGTVVTLLGATVRLVPVAAGAGDQAAVDQHDAGELPGQFGVHPGEQRVCRARYPEPPGGAAAVALPVRRVAALPGQQHGPGFR